MFKLCSLKDGDFNIVIKTSERIGIYELTEKFEEIVKTSKIDSGLLFYTVNHTTCGIFKQEFQKALIKDFIQEFQIKESEIRDREHLCEYRLERGTRHDCKICSINPPCDRKNTAAHILTSLYAKDNSPLLVKNSKIILGEFKRIGLVDFDGPRTRIIEVKAVRIESDY